MKKRTYKLLSIVFTILFTFLAVEIANSYFWTHYKVQSPIVIHLQAPVVPLEQKIISPIATSSAKIVPQAYAAPEEQLPPRARTIKAAVEKWGWKHFESFELLIDHESGFRPDAVNINSGACGIFQVYPCSKLPSIEIKDQIDWGLTYIAKRYGNPSNAWGFWQENNYY